MSFESFDVWLFAVDLVNYVFLKSTKLHSDALIDGYPNFVCKSFSDVLKTAVHMIKESVEREVSEEFAKLQQQYYRLRPDAYLQYGKELRQGRSYQGSDAECFLRFSVRMAFLAHCFHGSGDRRAQVSAVFVISDFYQHDSVRFGMWEALNRVAEKIVCATAAAVDKGQPRLQELLHAGPDSFHSPEIETVGQSYACNEKAGRDCLMKTARCNLLDCKDSSKSKPDEVSCSTRRRANHIRIREHALKSCLKPMPSLEESLESSMEELSISKALQFKMANEDGPLNSTAESEFSWKLGKTSKNSPKRSSIDRQIFRLSPISARNVRTFSPKSNSSFS